MLELPFGGGDFPLLEPLAGGDFPLLGSLAGGDFPFPAAAVAVGAALVGVFPAEPSSSFCPAFSRGAATNLPRWGTILDRMYDSNLLSTVEILGNQDL